MVRYVFYSFHYENDISRVMTVRNRWVTYGSQKASGIIDRAEFEKVQRKGDTAIKRWIDSQLYGTTATIVLIGAETLNRPYVQYEIMKSRERGNAIIGVYINNIRDMNGYTSLACSRYTVIGRERDGSAVCFDEVADGIYDYINDKGYSNMDSWVEKAIRGY